jgi:hypothetical protein
LSKLNLIELREALEASWDATTSYGGASGPGSPRGQCYPSAWVAQHFFPLMEIVEGEVWTGQSLEKHFWNVLVADGQEYHLDLTWQQFPPGSIVRSFKTRDRNTLGDTPATIERCGPLLDRVVKYLSLTADAKDGSTEG